MKLSAVEETGYLKSQFYKKSASQKSQTQSTDSAMCTTTDLDIVETKGENSGADLNESFKFRFNISDNSSESQQNSSSKGENANFSAAGNETTFKSSNFRMEKGDNTFRFNFDMTDET